MSHKPEVSSELSRELSLFHITMMGLGMMIGAGVFVGMGNAVAYAGPGGVMLTFALNGVLAIFTAMSYAELSSAIPKAGGAYNFTRVAFGRGPSFIAGWMEWFASSVAGSLYSVTFGIYVVRFFHVLGTLDGVPIPLPILEKLVAVAVALSFVYINYRGASETGRIGAFFTLGQTLFLILIGVMGAVAVIRDPSRLQNFEPFLPAGWSKLLATMGFTYVAFEGYEVIAQAGDEAIEPRKNLPKAMLYSVLIVTLTYVAVAFACIVAVKAGVDGVGEEPWRWIGSFKERGFGEAVARLMPFGNFFLTLAVIFASTSALNATIYSATRASYALGRDRMLPGAFAKISSKRKTPWVALLFTGVIVVTVATLLPTMDVASSASIMFLFLFFTVNISVIKVRLNMADELHYGYLMPLFPLFPLLALICQAVLAGWLVHMSLVAWIIAPLWIGAGWLLYRFYSRSRVTPAEHEITVVEEERALEGDEYRIMLAVANPDNALSMVRTTHALCTAKTGRVELIHMVPVPDQVPLSDAEHYMLSGKEAIGEMMLYLAPAFPLSTTIRYCRNVARGIISAVREKKVNMLIMGWHGRKTRHAFTIGSTVDPIMERVPSSVLVLKNVGGQKFRRVLVPVAGGPNSAFSLEIASILADNDAGEMVVFHVQSKSGEPFDLARLVEESRERIALPADRVRTKLLRAASPVEAILREAEDEALGYDLVVMGCNEEPLIYQFARESVPEMVAATCKKPMIMAKDSGGIKSWLKRWF